MQVYTFIIHHTGTYINLLAPYIWPLFLFKTLRLHTHLIVVCSVVSLQGTRGTWFIVFFSSLTPAIIIHRYDSSNARALCVWMCTRWDLYFHEFCLIRSKPLLFELWDSFFLTIISVAMISSLTWYHYLPFIFFLREYTEVASTVKITFLFLNHVRVNFCPNAWPFLNILVMTLICWHTMIHSISI